MNVCDNLGDHLVGNVYIKVGGSLSSDKAYLTCRYIGISWNWHSMLNMLHVLMD